MKAAHRALALIAGFLVGWLINRALDVADWFFNQEQPTSSAWPWVDTPA